MKTKLKNIADIAKRVGSYPEYTQGGGGNVSIKLNDTLMAVKASGFRLDDIRQDYGLVNINYAKLKDYYHRSKKTSDLITLIEENDLIVNECIDNKDSKILFRPSIETGFHAILGNVVIHTHSVYANLINCTKEGIFILEELSQKSLSIPYKTPGIALTYAIQEAMDKNPSDVLYLKNHGLITVGETHKKTYELNRKTNEKIKDYFKLTNPYPKIYITQLNNNQHLNQTQYLKDFILRRSELIQKFTETILFPDQIVYGEKISFDTGNPDVITIDLLKGEIIINGSAGFARPAVETLMAWSYLMETITELGLTAETLPKEESAFIANLESEKYRKSII